MRKRQIYPKLPEKWLLIIAVLALAFLAYPGTAIYDFEGIPFKTAAQGEITGKVLVFGSYGLRDPPINLQFDVPYEIQWARTYVGVWGGTPRYTGWVQTTVNGQPFEKITLYGQDDRTPNVYCTGYGVYWVAYDTTNLCRQGSNTITAITSQGQPENKLDGRIYAVVTVLVAKDPHGDNTRYWILEGNENLHGQGWSGLNPSQHEETTVTITASESDLLNTRHANLTVLYLTSSRGQPDYLTFNDQDLGTIVPGPNYPEGARDIANERSFDAGDVINPLDGRYFDIEVFHVTNLLRKGDNKVTFFRGRDMDGDGVITETGEKPEGEDYLHPVLVILSLERPRTPATTPDLMVSKIDVKDAYEGVTATIAVTLENLGVTPVNPGELKISVDGTPVHSQQVSIEKSGLQEVSASWESTPGIHTIRAEITVGDDSDTSNNALEKKITVGTLPDLVVSVGQPSRPGSGSQSQKSPIPIPVVMLAIGLAISGLMVTRNRRPPVYPLLSKILPLVCLALLISAGIGTISVPATADSSTSLYLLPVTVKNSGGSDAPPFSLSVYLDGEKVAMKTFDAGIPSGKEVTADIPVHTTPGTHALKIIADEEGKVRDGNRGNNIVEKTYVFP